MLGSIEIYPTLIRLKSFEMTYRGYTLRYSGISSLIEFLSLFNGLKTLLISYPKAVMGRFLQSVHYHKRTLR